MIRYGRKSSGSQYDKRPPIDLVDPDLWLEGRIKTSSYRLRERALGGIQVSDFDASNRPIWGHTKNDCTLSYINVDHCTQGFEGRTPTAQRLFEFSCLALTTGDEISKSHGGSVFLHMHASPFSCLPQAGVG